MRRFIFILYGGLVMVTPLIMSTQTSEMFEFPKIMIVYMISLIVATHLLYELITGALRISSTLLLSFLTAWVGTQALSTAASIDTTTSLYGYYGRFNGGLLSTAAYAVLILGAVNTLTRSQIVQIIRYSCVTALLVFLWGIPGRLGIFDSSCYLFRQDWSLTCWTNEFRPAERMFSTLGQPNWLGTYFAAHVLLAVAVWKRSERLHLNWGVALAIILSVGVWATGSRSAQVGLTAALLVVGVWYTRRWVSSRILYGLMMLGCITTYIFVQSHYAQWRTVKPGSITDSGTIRLIVWEGAWKIFTQNSLLGTGPETFAYVYPSVKHSDHNLTSEKDFIYNKVHNELLHILATTGILGFIAYAALIGGTIYTSLKYHEILPIAVLTSLQVSQFFGFSTSTSQILLVLMIAWVFANNDNDIVARRSIRLHRVGGVCAVAFIACTSIWWYGYLRADIAYARGNVAYDSDDLEKAIQSYATAYHYKLEHTYAHKLSMVAVQAAYALHAQDPSQTVVINDLNTLAESAMQQALIASTQNPVYWRDSARMYLLLQSTSSSSAMMLEKAHASIRSAQRLAPLDGSVHTLRQLLDDTSIRHSE